MPGRVAMKRSRKPKLILASALLAACAFAGGAWAASVQSTPASSRQAFIQDVAKRLGTTPQKLTAAMQGAYADELNAAVKAGRLTRAQANAIEHAMRQHGLGPVGPLFLGSASGCPGQGTVARDPALASLARPTPPCSAPRKPPPAPAAAPSAPRVLRRRHAASARLALTLLSSSSDWVLISVCFAR